MRNNVSFEEIEKALGFQLNAEQKAVLTVPLGVLWDMEAPTERCTGSSTAAALKILLSEGDDILYMERLSPDILYGHHFYENSANDTFLVKCCSRYARDDKTKSRFQCFANRVIELSHKLTSAGINVRPVTFCNRCSTNRLEKTSRQTLQLGIDVDTSALTALETILDRLAQKAKDLNEQLQKLNIGS